MSDNTFRLGRQDSAEAPSSGRDQRVVLVAGAVLAAVALAGGGVLLLGGGGEEQVQLASAPAPAGAGGTAGAASPSPSPSPSPTSVARVGRPRDPFHALYVAPVAAVASTTGPATATQYPMPTTTDDPAPTVALPTLVAAPEVPVLDPFPTMPTLGPGLPTADPAPTSEPSGSPAAAAAQRITLTRVLGEGADIRAEFLLDGVTQVAQVGEQVGGSEVRLLSLQEDPEDNHWTAVLKSGAGEPFDALIGVAVQLG